MNIIKNIKRFARTGVVGVVLAAAVIGGGVAAINHSPKVAADSCDKVNIIYCGLTGSDTAGKIKSFQSFYNAGKSNGHSDLQTVYNYTGTSKSLVASMNTDNTKGGYVHRNGDVTLGSSNTVVATNAMVAARFSVAGAVKIPGSDGAYLRKTTSSFAFEKELAIIRFDGNGKMLYAVIVSCGNAVKATPTPPPAPKTPNYTINKEVKVSNSSTYAKTVNVKPGTTVNYRITITSTGDAPVTNLVAKDALPANVVYTPNTLKRDGTAASTTFFTSGVEVGTLNNGKTTVFTFDAVIGKTDTLEKCVNEKADNTGAITATKLPGKDSTATVTKTCLPKPVYQCVKLTPTYLSRTNVSFKAEATAKNGATISAYVYTFGDGTTKTVSTVAASNVTAHEYTTPGTYTASVSVIVKIPGSADKTVTSPACATPVTIKEAPAAECKSLNLIQDETNPRSVSATAVPDLQHGATVTSVSFDWGDGTTVTPGTSLTASHAYGQDGDFTVKATLTFSAGVQSSTCEAPISVETIPPTCDELTIDVNNDDKSVVITGVKYTVNNGEYQSTTVNWGDNSEAVTVTDATGQTHTYSGNGPFTVTASTNFKFNGHDISVNCTKPVSFTETPPVTPPVTPPTALVNTGAGSVVGLFAGVAAIGAVGYRFFLSRRLSSEG